MKSLKDCYQLQNGVQIPCIGLGTWQMPDSPAAIEAFRTALLLGYRHIDSAAAYRNEESVGRAIKQSGIARSEIFITSKLNNPDHGYERTKAAFEQTMKNLGTDYLDLYLIHWPNPSAFRNRWQEANAGTWKAFEEFYRAGRIRAIGISNFHKHHIDELMKTAEVAPTVNQIRLCPGDTEDEVVSCSKAHGMLPEAYSPLGEGKVFGVPELQALSRKYGKSVAQICIRWSLQMGFLPLPKSANEARMRENADVFDFELTAHDVQAIADLKGCCGYSINPDTISW